MLLRWLLPLLLALSFSAAGGPLFKGTRVAQGGGGGGGAITYGAAADAGQTDDPANAPAYDADTLYYPGDMVTYLGSEYWAIARERNNDYGVAKGNLPTDTAYWEPVTGKRYMDATGGDDLEDGLTSATAWQTIPHLAKFLAHSLGETTLPRGTVILFKRGETFTGQIQINPGSGKSVHAYLLGAYGTGDRPRINHSRDPAPNGTARGNVWTAKDNMIFRNLHFDGRYDENIVAVADMTGDGVTVTANTTGPHGIVGNNNPVVVSGSGVADWNGIRTTTVVDEDTFTFPHATSGSTTTASFNQKEEGITWDTADNCAFVNGRLENIGADGINFSGNASDRCWIYNSTVHRAGLGGHPGNGTGGGGSYITIAQNTYTNNGVDIGLSHGIYLSHWGTDSLIRRNSISLSSNFGINTGAFGVNPTILENDVFSNNNGMDVSQSSGGQRFTGLVTIRGNKIRSNGVGQGWGILGINSTPQALVENNLLYGNPLGGISVNNSDTGTENVVVRNNTIVLPNYAAGSSEGIQYQGALTGMEWYNNIVYSVDFGTNVAGLERQSSMLAAELTSSNNCYHLPNAPDTTKVINWAGTMTALATLQPTWEANSIVGDPLFTNVGADDYTLQAGSPCKNAGIAGPATDLNGDARSPTTPSIGAFE